jgi:hypothetical protein
MIKRNFDRVWGQNEDMFQDFREKMESDTQRALLKVDEEVSTHCIILMHCIHFRIIHFQFFFSQIRRKIYLTGKRISKQVTSK